MNANIFDNNLERNMLLELNTFIHNGNSKFDYHMKHIHLVRKYALILNKKLDAHLNSRKLSYVALAHDLFKERSLDPKLGDSVVWRGHIIPQDTNRYVRSNLDVLSKYGLDEYFCSGAQYHSLSAGIFIHKEFGITDPEILYPIMFHSCPIISVYETLDNRTKNMVDIIMLADKLSSNYLRINYREVPVRIDLDQIVFGNSGKEFNYSLGLFIARLIGQGNLKDDQSVKATEYYYKRLEAMNPVISKNYSIKKLGGAKIWQKRQSQALIMH